VVICEIKSFWNNFEIISAFHFTCNHVWNWNKTISAEIKLFQSLLIISKLFQRHWTCCKVFLSCS